MENIEQKEQPIQEEIVIIESVVEEPKKKKFTISYRAVLITVIVIIVLALLYIAKGLIVAATVNGVPISRWSVIKQTEKNVGQTTLDSMIRERLINMEAAKKGIVVSEDEINEEIKKVEDSLTEQNMKLDDALAEQGMTRNDLRQRIITQKNITKLIGDIEVTDKEVEEYIKNNSFTLTKGKEAEEKADIKEQLKNQKLGDDAAALVEGLMNAAKIKYWVKY